MNKDGHREAVAQNVRMIGDLALLGHTVNVGLHMQAAVECLIEIAFPEPEQLAEFHYLVDLNLNAKLREMLAHASSHEEHDGVPTSENGPATDVRSGSRGGLHVVRGTTDVEEAVARSRPVV